MRDFEKSLCNDMIRYGHIVSDKEFTIDGDNVRQYAVIYDGCKFKITKENGEWVYLHHCINE